MRRCERLILVLAGFLILPACASAPKSQFDQARSSIDTISNRADHKIEDESLRTEVHERLRDFRDVVTRLEAIETDYRTELRRLNSDYTATRDEFESLFREYDTHRGQAREDLLRVRQGLASALTPELWQDVIAH